MIDYDTGTSFWKLSFIESFDFLKRFQTKRPHGIERVCVPGGFFRDPPNEDQDAPIDNLKFSQSEPVEPEFYVHQGSSSLLKAFPISKSNCNGLSERSSVL
jgi:hypothetical protein